MRLTLITPPSGEPVPLADVKLFARVDHDDEDTEIASMISTARRALDGREGLLGRALMAQTWKLTLDAFPRYITLPLPPLQNVTAITYLDAAGEEQILAGSAYVVEGAGDADPAIIRPAKGTTWPATWDFPGSVELTFVAGYGDAADVPEPLRHAIKMHAAHLYENREAISSEAGRMFPMGYDDHVAPYRLWSL